jgi:hypothetical protein
MQSGTLRDDVTSCRYNATSYSTHTHTHTHTHCWRYFSCKFFGFGSGKNAISVLGYDTCVLGLGYRSIEPSSWFKPTIKYLDLDKEVIFCLEASGTQYPVNLHHTLRVKRPTPKLFLFLFYCRGFLLSSSNHVLSHLPIHILKLSLTSLPSGHTFSSQSVNVYQTIRCHILDDTNFFNYLRENFKFINLLCVF